MSEQQRKTAPSTFVDFDRWGVWSAPTQEGHKGTRLSFGYRIDEKGRSIPRISVNTGNPEDEFKGFVSQGFQLEVMNTVLDLLEKVALGEPTRPYTLENYGTVGGEQENGGRNTEKVLRTKLAIGKDESGIVWIGLVADGRTKRKIDLVFNEYHRLFHPDQTPFTAADGSKLQALSLVRGLRAAYEQLAAVKKPAFEPNGTSPSRGPRKAAVEDQEFAGLDL